MTNALIYHTLKTEVQAHIGKGKLLALLETIRPGWMCLTATNALAYNTLKLKYMPTLERVESAPLKPIKLGWK